MAHVVSLRRLEDGYPIIVCLKDYPEIAPFFRTILILIVIIIVIIVIITIIRAVALT